MTKLIAGKLKNPKINDADGKINRASKWIRH
jgi:hypothetical protein